MLKNISAVIFDLDGTLLDTKKDFATAVNLGLEKCGLPLRTLEEYNQVLGGGIRNAISIAAPAGTSEAVLDDVYKYYLGYYPYNSCVHTTVYPGMSELLDELVNQNISVAVITNKNEEMANDITNHYFPDVPFKFIWGNTGSRPLKPSTEVGFQACEALGLEPEKIIYVGDSDTDIIFANDVGMISAGAAWGYRGAEELQNAGAKLVLHGPLDLLS